MNQQELADRLGVSQQTISKYENGEREPDHNTLTKISELFSVSIDYLLGQTDIRNPYDESNIENYTNEIEDILETIHKRPEIKALFSLSKKASKEDDVSAAEIMGHDVAIMKKIYTHIQDERKHKTAIKLDNIYKK